MSHLEATSPGGVELGSEPDQSLITDVMTHFNSGYWWNTDVHGYSDNGVYAH